MSSTAGDDAAPRVDHCRDRDANADANLSFYVHLYPSYASIISSAVG